MKKVINFFRRLFLKKEKEIILKPEVKTKEPEQIYEKKDQKFSQLIKNIEENRDSIIKEKQENELKVIPSDLDGVCLSLKKKLFLLDNEGFELFREKFNLPEYTLFISYSKKGYYLARRNNETDKEEFFHRFLMKKEIEDFQLERGCLFEEIVVHHDNFEEWDDRKENLKIMTKEEHDILHNRK